MCLEIFMLYFEVFFLLSLKASLPGYTIIHTETSKINSTVGNDAEVLGFWCDLANRQVLYKWVPAQLVKNAAFLQVDF